ncbi:MAG: DUF6036 family nucleotidyltransferase [Nanoarchaeota archaeon]
MITLTQQNDLFISIGNLLSKKIKCYAIGGTAMMIRGIKSSTLDIDLVFNNSSERIEFINAVKKLGGKDSDVTLVYREKINTPHLISIPDARFDLFLEKIITSTFSNNMKSRANQIHEYGKNLIILPADPIDIIIMKSATSRDKDLEDITLISNSSKINWNLILEELKEQIILGNEWAILSFGENFEKLKDRNALSIPQDFWDALWTLLNEQISKKMQKK